MEVSSLRVELETLLRAGELRAILDRVRAEPTTCTDAWVAVYACRAAGALGAWQEAIRWAERGLALKPEDEPACWLHFLLGTALMYACDPNRSLKSLQHFLCLAEVTPAVGRLVPEGWFNLGFAYRFLHETQSEVAAFRTAAERFERNGRFTQGLLAKAEAAWSYLMAGMLTEARLFLEAAEAGMEEHGAPHLETYLGICRGLYHHLNGEPEISRVCCLALIDRSDLSPGMRADLLWILGCLAHRSGDYGQAMAFADSAYQTAISDWWPLQLERIEELLASLKSHSLGQ